MKDDLFDDLLASAKEMVEIEFDDKLLKEGLARLEQELADQREG